MPRDRRPKKKLEAGAVVEKNPNCSGGGGKKPPKKEKHLLRRGHQRKICGPLDVAVDELILSIGESDNTDQTRDSQQEVALVKYLQKNAEQLYPNIGKETYRVPDVHFNKGKEGEKIMEGITALVPPQETDSRSDRAHSFVSDMVYHLSSQLQSTSIGPFFIISSYEYDHYLSRLKTAFENKTEGNSVQFSKGSGYERGEVDIVIIIPKHVIFVEVKAVGDNFDQYDMDNPGDIRKASIKSAIKKASDQLIRDEKVFNHVMKDLNIEDFKRTKIAALPNLEREYLEDMFRGEEQLAETCKAYKFLCKEVMPKDRYKFEEDFEKFKLWWMSNVFPDYSEEDMVKSQVCECPEKKCRTAEDENDKNSVLADEEKQGNESPAKGKPNSSVSQIERTPLDIVKIIVGRYVGFMSVVTVCNNSNSNYHRNEIRCAGQAASYLGERFAEIVLTTAQKQYVFENIKLGYLCGPPGSGKTVVLAVKARRWILHDDNFVVIVNMYRGAPGRAIGKQIFKTVTANSDEAKENHLKSHCLEIGVDVDKFEKDKFLKEIRSKWGEEIGDKGQRLMFLVDETYVQSYWKGVFSALREDFLESSMWCAGLYGKQPDGFTSMELKEVIRCPPKVQHILLLIDWDDNRKKCYVKDSTEKSLPADGMKVLTVRHQKHLDYKDLQPSQCPACGWELINILEKLHVEKPDSPHHLTHLQIRSLKCSEVLFLVNMPRTEYEPDRSDRGHYLDTTEEKYKAYMNTYKDCPMLKELEKAGYPSLVHDRLPCPGLIPDTDPAQQVIHVTWIYTYQGLENKVIVFIPGDEAMPDRRKDLPSYLIDAFENIPCPGLQGSNDEISPDAGSEGAAATAGQALEGNSLKNGSGGNGDGTNQTSQSDSHKQSKSSQEQETNVSTENSSGAESQRDKLAVFDNTDRTFREKDVERYTRWDKNNLFISASRCTSQLILVTR